MRRFVGIFCLIWLVGCSKTETMSVEKTVPVSGIAVYKGKALEGYKVFFSNGENRTATGLVDFEGRFVLGTNNVGDGAPPGEHRVWLAYEPEITIEAGKEEEALILPPSVEIPKKFLNPGTSGLTANVPEAGLTDYKLELE